MMVFRFACLSVLALGTAYGNIVTSAQIDTSSINGASGFLDFQFGGGGSPQLATAVISGFSTDGSLGAPSLTGNATGALPGEVTLTNTGFPPDDYYTPILFGQYIRFVISFSGPAVSAPDGVSDSSTFAFMILDETESNPLLVPVPFPPDDPGGFGFLIDLNNDGSVSPKNFMPTAQVFAVPEPGSVLFLAGGVAGLLALARRRSRR